jgi:hypothetical protein
MKILDTVLQSFFVQSKEMNSVMRLLKVLISILVTLGLFTAVTNPALAVTSFSVQPTSPETYFHNTYFTVPHNTYDHGSTLTSWLDIGLRSVELDVVDSGDWENDPNGPYVSHGGEPGNKNCSASNNDRLGDCLRDIMGWLDTHPISGPILVFIDMKTSSDPLNDWKNDEVYFLDQKVYDIVGSRLYTAPNLYYYATGTNYTPTSKSLRQAVSERGWPKLQDLNGKIIVAYTGGVAASANQTQGAGIEYIVSRSGRTLPYGFFCPDVENDPGEVQPGGTVDGMSQTTSQYLVCSNLKAQDHYQVTANRASDHRQIIHLWGNHVYSNNDFVFNYIAVAHGISAIGRDQASDTFGNAIPFTGVRRSIPGYFQLRPMHTYNKCMNVYNSGTGNGTKVVLSSCAGTSNQSFVYTPEGQLRPRHINKQCVDIKGGDAGSGKDIHLWDCDGGNSEKWLITSNGEFKSYDGQSYCLGVYQSGTANGTPFKTLSCSGGLNQKFMLYGVPQWTQTSF